MKEIVKDYFVDIYCGDLFIGKLKIINMQVKNNLEKIYSYGGYVDYVNMGSAYKVGVELDKAFKFMYILKGDPDPWRLSATIDNGEKFYIQDFKFSLNDTKAVILGISK